MARNTKPTLTASNQSFIEDQVQTSFSSLGALSVTDPDLNQTLTAYISKASLSFSGGTLPRSQLQSLTTALVEGKLVFDSTAVSGGTEPKPITYSWNPDDVDLDFMTPGQSLTITYKVYVSDGSSKSAAQDLTFTITGVNDAPRTVADTLDAVEDTAAIYAVSTLLANDSDPDSPTLTLTSVSSGNGGTVALNADGTIAFTPDADFHGPATFRYTVSDGSLSADGDVTVNVAAVNDAPVAVDETLDAIEDTQVTYAAGALTGNDTDPDSPALTIASVTSGANGTAALNADGTVTFTPDANFHGPATFSYTVTDGSLSSAPATVTVNVAAVNDAPTTSQVTLAAIAEDSGPRLITQAELLVNASDVDDAYASLTATGLAIVAGAGSLVDNGNGTWNYTAALNDDTSVGFSYTISDGSLGTQGSATLDITPVNDAPTTSPVTLAAIAEDSGPRLITQAELLVNAIDIDDAYASLTATGLVIVAGAGSLVNNGNGTWYYTPALNDDTSVSFSYTITDNGTTNGSPDPKSVVGTATLDITPVPDNIYAPYVSWTTTGPDGITFLAEDPDGPALGYADPFSSFGPVNNGTLTVFTPLVLTAVDSRTNPASTAGTAQHDLDLVSG